MGQITNIHNQLHTRLAAVLSDHVELSDSVNIEENDRAELKKGYGLNFSGSRRISKNVSCVYNLQREITVTNTVEIFGGDRDKTIKKTMEKQLLENQEIIIHEFENNVTLNDTVDKIEFVQGGGIQPVYSGNENIIMLQSIFVLEYQKNF